MFLKKSDTGLSKDSVVLTPQIGIVDKSCLVEKVSKLSPAIMLNISAAISDLLAI
ncbi:MAG: type II toxin-antitoxin system PemK/MazF family toxin [Treponema sp.]|nr:type II toxin-antitoxin system PemK/MazF family toxin [Treponema sp.]